MCPKDLDTHLLAHCNVLLQPLASGRLAKVVVIAHSKQLHAKTLHKHLSHEALGRQGGHCVVKIEQNTDVHACSLKMPYLLAQGREQERRALFVKEPARMGGKGHHH